MTHLNRSAGSRGPVALPTRRGLALSAVGITALAACAPWRDEEDSVTTSEGTCHPAAKAPPGASP